MATQTRTRTRVSIKFKCPNPLFEEWLTNWKAEAIAKNSKLKYTFNLALQSLKKYPLPLETGQQCKILKGFGDKLCKMLDNKLKEYRSMQNNHSLVTNTLPVYTAPSISSPPKNNSANGAKPKRILKPNTQKPETITKEIVDRDLNELKTLIAIEEAKENSLIFSSQIQSYSQYPVAGQSTNLNKMQAVGTNSQKPATITRLNSFSEICTNEVECLEIEESSPVKFLSSFSSARLHRSDSNSLNSVNNLSQQHIINGGAFDIILYVDKCETYSNKDKNEIITNLTRRQIKFEVKDLKIGDFTWVCRERYGDVELVLPYIIERKRMDDLAHSITDKRYHEQKFRLKKSGIENLIYLVESYGQNRNFKLPIESLYQAACNTAIQDNFFVKFTDSTVESAEYLSNMTKMLIQTFKSKKLISCSRDNIPALDIHSDTIHLMQFNDFNQSSVKNKGKQISDLFVAMLLQIKGMSAPRALAIVEQYPTPTSLMQAYEHIPSTFAEKLLADIKYDKTGKKIGLVLSKIVYLLFNKSQY